MPDWERELLESRTPADQRPETAAQNAEEAADAAVDVEQQNDEPANN